MLDTLLHKEVLFRTHGKDLSFSLSMGLFSSNDIDTGSILLIDELIAHADIAAMDRVLDAGCGVGTLGITLKALYPGLEVTATDRDALALAVTAHNAEKNGTPIMTAPGLDTLIWDGDHDGFIGSEGSYDLVMTNIPAKAGAPVLKRFLQNGLFQLTDTGIFAFVIVDTLNSFAEQMCAELSCEIIHKHDGPRHTVFLLRRTEETVCPLDTGFPGVYARCTAEFSVGKSSYTLDTAYSIPGFDTVPYEAALGMAMAEKHVGTSLAVWNPGQGHAAVGLLKEGGVREVCLAGRDLLALLISRHSIARYGNGATVSIIHTHSITEFLSIWHMPHSQPQGLLVIFPDPIPLVPFRSLVESSYLVAEKKVNASIILASKSSVLAPFTRGLPGFILKGSKKKNGFRAIFLQNLY